MLLILKIDGSVRRAAAEFTSHYHGELTPQASTTS